jgi:hypothetical protein
MPPRSQQSLSPQILPRKLGMTISTGSHVRVWRSGEEEGGVGALCAGHARARKVNAKRLKSTATARSNRFQLGWQLKGIVRDLQNREGVAPRIFQVPTQNVEGFERIYNSAPSISNFLKGANPTCRAFGQLSSKFKHAQTRRGKCLAGEERTYLCGIF